MKKTKTYFVFETVENTANPEADGHWETFLTPAFLQMKKPQ